MRSSTGRIWEDSVLRFCDALRSGWSGRILLNSGLEGVPTSGLDPCGELLIELGTTISNFADGVQHPHQFNGQY